MVQRFPPNSLCGMLKLIQKIHTGPLEWWQKPLLICTEETSIAEASTVGPELLMFRYNSIHFNNLSQVCKPRTDFLTCKGEDIRSLFSKPGFPFLSWKANSSGQEIPPQDWKKHNKNKHSWDHIWFDAIFGFFHSVSPQGKKCGLCSPKLSLLRAMGNIMSVFPSDVCWAVSEEPILSMRGWRGQPSVPWSCSQCLERRQEWGPWGMGPPFP